MGLDWSASRSSYDATEEDAPWLAAVRDVDCRRGLSAEQVAKQRRRQSQLPVEIAPHLYLSTARAATDVEVLRRFRVTHAVNAAGRAARDSANVLRRERLVVLDLEGRDVEGFPMLPRFLDRTRAFVRRAQKEGGKVLIFCVAGQNRSGVLCAAEYMLATPGVTVLDAVRHCRRCRGNLLLSNRSFQAQLVALARRHGTLGPRPASSDDERS